MSYGRPPPRIDGMVSLKVDNLTYRTTPEDLRRVFERCGEVGDIYIPRDRFSRESRGFAFVRWVTEPWAERSFLWMRYPLVMLPQFWASLGTRVCCLAFRHQFGSPYGQVRIKKGSGLPGASALWVTLHLYPGRAWNEVGVGAVWSQAILNLSYGRIVTRSSANGFIKICVSAHSSWMFLS